MKKHNLIIIISIFILALLAVILSPAKQDSIINDENEALLTVAATIFPVYDIMRNITAGVADTVLVVPAGSSPHTFTVGPSQVKDLYHSDVLFSVGSVDNWTLDLVRSVPDLEIIEVSKNISFLNFEEGHSHDHDSEVEDEEEYGHNSEDEEGHEEEHNIEMQKDPHYWLSPKNAIIIAQNITETMIKVDEGNKEIYEDNLLKYTATLVRLNRDMEKVADEIQNKKIIVMHDSWNYFAHDFDIEIVGVFEAVPGADPLPGDLVKITHSVEEGGARAIFNEPQLSSTALSSIASDLNIGIYTLDPLGGLGDRDSYVSFMMYNIETIEKALVQ